MNLIDTPPVSLAWGDLLWRNRQWKAVWERSGRMAGVALLFALALGFTADWCIGQTFEESHGSALWGVTRSILIFLNAHLFTGTLILISLIALWRVRDLLVDENRKALVLVAVFLPPLTVWAGGELMRLADGFFLAQELSGANDRLLWLLNRPGQMLFLSDPGPPTVIVICHNVIAGSIAFLGYTVFAQIWTLGAIWSVRSSQRLGSAVVRFLWIWASVLIALTGIDALQNHVGWFSPQAPWVFPPGTVLGSHWLREGIEPMGQLAMYGVMHLSILLIQLGITSRFHQSLRGHLLPKIT